jgi:hypothetical protein
MKRKMKRKIVPLLMVISLAFLPIPQQLSAQTATPGSQLRYAVQTLRSLGGTYATAQQMNSSGLIVGDSNLTGDTIEHGVVWRVTAASLISVR